MRIRKINSSDVDRIVKLLAKKYPGEKIDDIREHTEWHIKGFPEFCLIAEKDGKLLGFIICHLHADSLEIEELYAVNGKEHVFKRLILEVLRRIPKVDTIIMWLDNFKELIGQLK